MPRKAKATEIAVSKETGLPAEPIALPTPNISRMGYNPANFAYWIGAGPWVCITRSASTMRVHNGNPPARHGGGRKQTRRSSMAGLA